MDERRDRPTGGVLLRTIAAGLLLVVAWAVMHGLVYSLAERFQWTR
jgi:hypothetical protein